MAASDVHLVEHVLSDAPVLSTNSAVAKIGAMETADSEPELRGVIEQTMHPI